MMVDLVFLGLKASSGPRFYPQKAEGSKHPRVFACKLSNGNWLCQIHSYLEFTPKPGEKISCRVEKGNACVLQLLLHVRTNTKPRRPKDLQD
uniref:Uncharacterized protein n=1 Tax=Amphiprion ocellaris TaxID=80972 RepID=A0AAQ5XFU8_AMPOC